MPSRYTRFTIVLEIENDADILAALKEAARDNGASDLARRALRQYITGNPFKSLEDQISEMRRDILEALEHVQVAERVEITVNDGLSSLDDLGAF